MVVYIPYLMSLWLFPAVAFDLLLCKINRNNADDVSPKERDHIKVRHEYNQANLD